MAYKDGRRSLNVPFGPFFGIQCFSGSIAWCSSCCKEVSKDKMETSNYVVLDICLSQYLKIIEFVVDSFTTE